MPFMLALGEPLGFPVGLPLTDRFAALRLMDVPIYADGKVRYEHLLQGVIRWSLRIDMNELRFKYEDKGITPWTVAHLLGVTALQRTYRRRRLARRAMGLKEAVAQEIAKEEGKQPPEVKP